MNPIIKGTAQNDDIYFQAVEVRNKFYSEKYKCHISLGFYTILNYSLNIEKEP